LVPNGASSRAWLVLYRKFVFYAGRGGKRGLITGSASGLLTAAVRESFCISWFDSAQLYYPNNTISSDFNGVPQELGITCGQIFTIISPKGVVCVKCNLSLNFLIIEKG
jgi:hypothetical protein